MCSFTPKRELLPLKVHRTAIIHPQGLSASARIYPDIFTYQMWGMVCVILGGFLGQHPDPSPCSKKDWLKSANWQVLYLYLIKSELWSCWLLFSEGHSHHLGTKVRAQEKGCKRISSCYVSTRKPCCRFNCHKAHRITHIERDISGHSLAYGVFQQEGLAAQKLLHRSQWHLIPDPSEQPTWLSDKTKNPCNFFSPELSSRSAVCNFFPQHLSWVFCGIPAVQTLRAEPRHTVAFMIFWAFLGQRTMPWEWIVV